MGDVTTGETDATTAVPVPADGDGSALTRMPQPASSMPAPAAASTPARHLGLTSASSVLIRVFRRTARHTLAADRV
jgi:hypothetical protein